MLSHKPQAPNPPSEDGLETLPIGKAWPGGSSDAGSGKEVGSCEFGKLGDSDLLLPVCMHM